MEITADRQDGWRIGDPAVTGGYPFVPLGIDEEVFDALMRYTVRVAYYSFGEGGWQLQPWWWWAQNSINGQAQYGSTYKWVPKEIEAADVLFAAQGARKFVNPDFGPETLKTVEPSTILATYKERVWLYRQEWYGRTGYNKFEEVGLLGDILMFISHDKGWIKGYPDRMFTALRYWDLLEDVPRLVGRYWTKIAAIYLGRGEKLREGEYYLRRADKWRANLRSPSTTWMAW